jgi:hypothetical protein
VLLYIYGVGELEDNSIITCPHCEKEDWIHVVIGEEICWRCGLDPNEQYLPSDINHLWKSGSEIQEMFARDKIGRSPDGNIGFFIRNMCGPHCYLAPSCPQSRLNFIRCYTESKKEIEKKEVDACMGRSRKNRKRKGKCGKAYGGRQKLPKTAAIEFSEGGWYGQTFKNKVEPENNVLRETNAPDHRDGTENKGDRQGT